jgi:hypothetical protein
LFTFAFLLEPSQNNAGHLPSYLLTIPSVDNQSTL